MGDVGAFDALKEGVKSAFNSCCSETRTFVTLFDPGETKATTVSLGTA